jgi:hypothetical protein
MGASGAERRTGLCGAALSLRPRRTAAVAASRPSNPLRAHGRQTVLCKSDPQADFFLDLLTVGIEPRFRNKNLICLLNRSMTDKTLDEKFLYGIILKYSHETI